MEVTSLNFECVFPRVIDAYMRSAFIAIDCEFSGIRAFDANDEPIRTPLHGGVNLAPLVPGMDPTEQEGPTGVGSPLEDEAYRRLRSAAQKYTVLQLGMTFAWIDQDRSDLFKTETYSFLVSPFLDWSTGEGVKICRVLERDITVNSASVQFLQSSKFNFRALLGEGLRYLTYSEEKMVKEYVGRHSQKTSWVLEREIQAEEDQEDKRTRDTISKWLAHNGAQIGERLRLFPLEGKPMKRSWVSRVHSVVRDEFENCRSWKDPEDDCVVIKHVDLVAEKERHAGQENVMRASIRKAIGLRNVLDLILRKDLSEQVIPSEFAEAHIRATELEDWDPKSEAEKDIERKRAIKSLDEKLSLLRTHQITPILVGHNLGWDISFLTEAFLHPLPDTLGAFMRTIDGMFPCLLDTRTLAANHSDKFRDLDLSAIHAALLGEGQVPKCYWEPGMGYRSGSAHDAGYDSFITAEAFLRMGQKLVENRRERRGESKLDQRSVNREIVDWGNSIWDPFRGKFTVYGQRPRG